MSDQADTQSSYSLQPHGDLNPVLMVSGHNLTATGADGRVNVFPIGKGRGQVALLTEYRTHIPDTKRGDVEYRGLLLRENGGKTLAWVANTPVAATAYASDDINGFCDATGLDHDELILEHAALLRLVMHIPGLGAGTAPISRGAATLNPLSGLAVLLGAIGVFLALAVQIAPTPIHQGASLMEVVALFVGVLLVFGAAGWWLSGTHAAERGRRIWWAASFVVLLATIVGAIAFHTTISAVIAIIAGGIGISIWLAGIPAARWARLAVQPANPR